MTKLSLIEAEHRKVAGRLSEERLRATGEALCARGEAHWPEVRGTEKAPVSSRRLTDVLREVEVA